MYLPSHCCAVLAGMFLREDLGGKIYKVYVLRSIIFLLFSSALLIILLLKLERKSK